MATVSRLMHARNVVVGAVLLLALSHRPEAQGIFVAPPAEPVLTATRAAQMEAFANRWASELLARQGSDRERQRRQLWSLFSRADAANIEDAAKQSTFAGAVAALRGEGYKVSNAAPAEVVAGMAIGALLVDSPEALGSVGSDMVFTPITPCRIVDTRVAGGAIAAGGTRSFVASNATNYTSQGGSATNCGMQTVAPGAVALNVTAVFPTAGPGFATVYPYATTRPLASSLNYGAGDIVNNALIVQVPDPLAAYDFIIYTAAQSHYVVDIVGFFDTNPATALQCVETANTDLVITANGGTGNANAPACPVGYTQTATNCETTSWLMPLVYFQSGTCSARNGDTVNQTLRASRTCCRVPGR